MDFAQKNIHFNRITKEAKNQITLEEDMNLPDVKEDMEEIIFFKHQVVLEDIKAGEQKVYIRGKLQFSILYKSEETGQLCSFVGNVPIDEQLYMEDVHNTDKVEVKCKAIDFSVGMIHSRKISVQGILELHAYLQELYDEEITVGMNGTDFEIQPKECDFSQLTVCKKDVMRIRENIAIPNNMPNIEELIFSSVKVCDLESRQMDDQISLQGKATAFFLYNGEKDSQNQMYQTTFPFNANLECTGSKPNGISQINYELVDSQVHLETDYDEETRNFEVDLLLELDIKMYEPQKVNILSDLYGIQKEATPVLQEFHYNIINGQYSGTIKVVDKVKTEMLEQNNTRILYSEEDALLESCAFTKEGIVLKGVLMGQILYMTEGEMKEFASYRFMIPFEKKLEETKNIEVASYHTDVHCKDMQIAFDTDGGLEVTGNITYNLLVFEDKTEKNIVDVEVKERDTNKINQLPSMAVCFVSEGESLWDFGKKYCVPVRKIVEINQLTKEEVNEGDKILIVRG